MDDAAVRDFVDRTWEKSVLPELTDYIRIPAKSPAFDHDWQAHGYIDEATARFERWAHEIGLKNAEIEVMRIEGRTPLLLIDVPGVTGDCVLLYGHLDKQPEMTGWSAGTGPWQPMIREERLYGRGGADDGYAMFACLSAIASLQAKEIPHARCVVLIEACEESGSFDLPPYIGRLADRIDRPSLVIALDSGCGNYDQLWCTTSLRGVVGGTLVVKVLTEGVHSGDAGGIVPCSFRLLRQLLSRVEDQITGDLLIRETHVTIPEIRLKQALHAAEALGRGVYEKFPFAGNMRPVSEDPVELILNRTWRPALSVIGAAGMPPIEDAGNVLRPLTAVKLSLRLPPVCDAGVALRKLKETLEKDPPHGAEISFEPNWAARGWDAPQLADWLERSLEEASKSFFGRSAAFMGEGGTIPFMSMLGERFPQAQFLVTGVLGPHANAHGPNEFLHLPTARKLTCCVARVLADHARHPRR